MAAVFLTLCAAAAPRSLPPLQCLDGAGLPSADAPLRLDGGMTRPRLVRRVAPDLPNGPQRVEGVIIIETIIDRKGRICDARLVKGSGPLADSLLAAVKQWEFEPASKNGKPVPVFYTVTVNVCPR
jgi:TonB family protein